MVRPPKNQTTAGRTLIIQFILTTSNNGKPRRGAITEAATKWNVSRSCVSRLWAATKKQRDEGKPIQSISGHKNRKKWVKHTPDFAVIKSFDVSLRTTLRKMESSLKAMENPINISRSTLCRWHQKHILFSHTNSIKPYLTADNKFLRIRFSLESLHLDRILNKLRFQNMHNVVHIDEKWFYITKGSNRYYLTPDEEEPYRACQSKKFIGKIMFLCAVSRPILNEDGSVLFDGKIGIFPFTHQVEAQRRSRNRDRGTLETKAINSVTRQVMKETLINKVIPTIKAKWPEGASKNIIIQQDNAKPHITNSDPEFRAVASSDGFNICLVQQPPNSPDCNVNDLGWFRAIQSLQQQITCKTVDDLVNAVMESFYELQPSTLNNVFLSLQGVMTEILKVKGHNNYKLPHMGKEALIRANALPDNLDVPLELARDCIDYLIQEGQINGIEALMHRLGIEQLTGLISI